MAHAVHLVGEDLGDQFASTNFVIDGEIHANCQHAHV